MSGEDHDRKKAERAARFERSASSRRLDRSSSSSHATSAVDNTLHTLQLLRNVAQRGGPVDWDSVVIKGTCTNIRKDYYRMNDMIPDQAQCALNLCWKKPCASSIPTECMQRRSCQM